MLRLRQNRETRWIELDIAGVPVRIKIRPLTTAIIATARNEVTKRLAAETAQEESKEATGFPVDRVGLSVLNPNYRAGLFEQWFAESLLRIAGEEWEGVGDEDGNVLPLDVAGARAFSEIEAAASAFLRVALADIGLLDAEGNGSAPSLNGAGEGAGSTAPGVAKAAAEPARLN